MSNYYSIWLAMIICPGLQLVVTIGSLYLAVLSLQYGTPGHLLVNLITATVALGSFLFTSTVMKHHLNVMLVRLSK